MVFSTTQSFISLYSMTPQLISDEERLCQEYQRRDKFVSDDKNIVRAHQLHLLASEPFRSATGTMGQMEPMKLVSPRCSTCFVFKDLASRQRNQGNGTKTTEPRHRNSRQWNQGNGTWQRNPMWGLMASEPRDRTQTSSILHTDFGWLCDLSDSEPPAQGVEATRSFPSHMTLFHIITPLAIPEATSEQCHRETPI